MKKRIGWLYNKPIIQGDKNLKTPNELHIDELSSNSSGEGEESEIKYYKVDAANVSLANYDNLKGAVGMLSRAIKYKLNNQSKTIGPSATDYNKILNDSEGIIYAFSTCPIIIGGIEINSLEDILAFGLTLEVEVKEITKEEFYDLTQ